MNQLQYYENADNAETIDSYIKINKTKKNLELKLPQQIISMFSNLRAGNFYNKNKDNWAGCAGVWLKMRDVDIVFIDDNQMNQFTDMLW